MICLLSVSLLQAGKITDTTSEVVVTLDGKRIVINRLRAQIDPLYKVANRGIIQPMVLAQGVETIGELEVIEYMKKAQIDPNIVLVDARPVAWYNKIRIPGTLNVPFRTFMDKQKAEFALGALGAVKKVGKWDFSNAKTIVIFCNGAWCKQAPSAIKYAKYSLLNMGYPASKIKWYRGGLQDWDSLGLTVEKGK